MIKQKMEPLIKNYDYMFHERCLRCGRKLNSHQSKILGYGPSCYKKSQMEKSTVKKRRLF
ncbi:MAG: DUF6011 domain-containing protein [Romboutsia timonensis]